MNSSLASNGLVRNSANASRASNSMSAGAAAAAAMTQVSPSASSAPGRAARDNMASSNPTRELKKAPLTRSGGGFSLKSSGTGYPKLDGATTNPMFDMDMNVLPRTLHGVPESLRSWWERVDPNELERTTLRSGRNEVLSDVARRVRKCARVLDLGCGPGLLAKEAGRSDIVGVDMSAQMLHAARSHMEVVVPDNLLEYYPPENFDAAVLCNVLEPYPAEMWRVAFAHVFDFLNPGGKLIVVTSSQALRPFTSDGIRGASCLELLFPSDHTSTILSEDVEDELAMVGFDVQSPELVVTNTFNQSAQAPGEELPSERRSYCIIVGEKPG